MFRRMLLANTAIVLVVGMIFAASVAQATPLKSSRAEIVVTSTPTGDQGGLVPFPIDVTREGTILSGIITTARLRVRNAATLNGKTIFFLNHGQIVTILGIHTNRRWLKIQTGDGKVGWASVFYVELVGGKLSMLAFVQ